MIIRKFRLEQGYSQEQLADMAGISVRTLQRIERGASASPETLKCLAAVLDVDQRDLRKDAIMPASDQTTLPELAADEREAMEYVRDLQGFYVHAIAYAVATVAFVIINLTVTPGFFWAIFPVLGWGAGLAAHGLSVYEVINLFGRDWEKRQIAKRLGR